MSPQWYHSRHNKHNKANNRHPSSICRSLGVDIKEVEEAVVTVTVIRVVGQHRRHLRDAAADDDPLRLKLAPETCAPSRNYAKGRLEAIPKTMRNALKARSDEPSERRRRLKRRRSEAVGGTKDPVKSSANNSLLSSISIILKTQTLHFLSLIQTSCLLISVDKGFMACMI